MSQDSNNTENNNNNNNNNNDDSTLAKDSQGNVNISRGIIGLVSNPNPQPTVTEGTIADKVNPPSRFLGDDGKVKPVTAEDLDNRIKLERAKAGFDRETQEQIAIKARTEAQGFKYTPPEQFKDNPALAATPDNLQEGEPSVNTNQGEQVINVEENNSNNPGQNNNNTQEIKG